MKFERIVGSLVVLSLHILKCSSKVIYLTKCSYDYSGKAYCANVNLNEATALGYYSEGWNRDLHVFTIENSNIPIMPNFFDLKPSAKLNLINCSVAIINEKTFERVSMLGSLNLNHNKIEKLQTNTFDFLSNLTTLSLENNRIQMIGVDVFLPLLKLKYLYLARNFLTEIDFDTFKGPTNLESLDLSQNEITHLYSDTFILHKDLKMLNLFNNFLVKLELNAFKGCANLEFIVLSWNELSHLYSNTFVFQKRLKSLDLSNNFLVTLEFDVFSGPENLESIDLSNNRLAHLYPETFALYKGSKILNLSNNFLTRLDANIFESNNKITKLDLSNNVMMALDFVKHLCNIQHLNLRNCSLTGNLVEEMLKGLENPQKCVKHSTEPQGPLLETLDLSFNHIQSVNLTILPNLHNLKSLNIQSNNITNIPYNEIIENNPNFSQVVLSDNAWNCTYLRKMMIDLTFAHIHVPRNSNIINGPHQSYIPCVNCLKPENAMNSMSCPASSNDLANVEKTTFFPTILTSTTEIEEHFSSTLENLEESEANHESVTEKESTKSETSYEFVTGKQSTRFEVNPEVVTEKQSTKSETSYEFVTEKQSRNSEANYEFVTEKQSTLVVGGVQVDNQQSAVEKRSRFSTVLTSTPKIVEHFSGTPQDMGETDKQSTKNTLVVRPVQINNQHSSSEHVDALFKFNYIILSLLIVILILIVAFSIFHIRSYRLKRTKRYIEERAVCIFKKQFR